MKLCRDGMTKYVYTIYKGGLLMKRNVLILSFIIIVCLSSFVGTAQGDAMTPGDYEVTARGHNGDITINVQMDAGAIAAIDVVSHAETPTVSDAAFDAYIPAIVANQSTAFVDGVSGATLTCLGIRNAVNDAIIQAGGDPADFQTAIEKPAKAQTERQTDVLVIGSGIAGLSAAIEAAEEGVDVLVLEKLSHIGGNSLICGGFIYGTGSKVQVALGIDDGTVEDMVSYWMARAEGNADESMLRFVAARSGETIDWLAGLGVEMPFAQPSGINPINSSLLTANGGHGFIEPLEKKCEEMGIEIMLNTKADELILDENGAVIGAKATGLTDELTINAKKVIIATGGYDASREAKAKYSPTITYDYSFSSPGNTGDGIEMAIAAGADTVFKDARIGFRAVPGYTYNEVIGYLWNFGLMVNEKGERCFDESSDYPIMMELMLKDGSDMFYNLIDSRSYTPDWERLIAGGVAFKGETLDELATAIGVAPETLTATVERYNALAAAGADEDFGKNAAFLNPLTDGPFYAVKMVKATIGTMGGIKIDTDARVLDANGYSIANLYAAGACAHGDLFNQVYPASGTSIQVCTTFGRVAGAHAALSAKGAPSTNSAMRRATHIDRYDAKLVYSVDEAKAIAATGAAGFTNMRVFTIACKTTKEFAEAVLPAPLEAVDDPTVSFVICDSNSFSGLVVQMSCQYQGVPTACALGYVMDSDTSTLFGRNFLGEPKKVGDIYLDLTGNKLTAKVQRFGETICDMSATVDGFVELPSPDPNEPITYGENIDSYHFKYFLKPDGTGVEDVHMIGMRSYTVMIDMATIGDYELNVYKTSDDAYSEIPIGEMISASYMVCDQYITAETVVEDIDPEAYLPYVFFEHDDYREATFDGSYAIATPNKLG
jgi:flavocytochrome c